MVPTPFLEQWQQKGKANRRLHPPNNRPFNVLLVLNPLLQEQVWEDQAAYNRQEGSVADSIPTGRALSISSASTSAIDSVIRANTPPFLPVNPLPTQAHNNISGADFANSINAIYEEIISWRKNLLSIPSRQQGKKVIQPASEWLTLYNNTSFQGIALKVFMVIPALLMQKPSAKSKARDHVKILSQWLVIFSGKWRLFKVCSPQRKEDPLKTSPRSFQNWCYKGKSVPHWSFLMSIV